jgi:uncharacterized protein YbjT (DUF2867 family)
MDHRGKVILVIGATGQQGGAVVEALQKTDFAVRALVRPHPPADPKSKKARALEQLGVQIARGDLGDFDRLVKAMDGVYGVFSVTTFFQKGGVQREAEQGKRAADAARKAGVQHFVYSSVGGAERDSGIPHFESKWQVEQHIRAIGLPNTIIRPTTFMTNLQELSAPLRFIALSMSRASNAEKPLQMIAVSDIGKWVAHVFLQPETYLSQAIEIAGDEITFSQMIHAYQKVYGKKPKSLWLPPFLFSRGDLGKMFTWLSQSGYQADLKANRTAIPDLLAYEQFLALKRPS